MKKQRHCSGRSDLPPLAGRQLPRGQRRSRAFIGWTRGLSPGRGRRDLLPIINLLTGCEGDRRTPGRGRMMPLKATADCREFAAMAAKPAASLAAAAGRRPTAPMVDIDHVPDPELADARDRTSPAYRVADALRWRCTRIAHHERWRHGLPLSAARGLVRKIRRAKNPCFRSRPVWHKACLRLCDGNRAVTSDVN